MKRTLFTLIGALGLVTLSGSLVGCGDDDGGSGSIAITDVQSSYERAWCQKALECEFDAFTAMFAGDVDACVDYLHTSGEMMNGISSLIDAVNAGNTEYDGDAARQCLNSIRSTSCEAMYLDETAEACDNTFVGIQAAGANCTLDEECAGGWCDMRASCPGVCADAVPLDGSCLDEERCQKGLVCDNGTCALDPGPAGLDESCNMRECAYDLYCDWETSGNCLARVGAGQSCTDDDQCNHGLYCNSMGECEDPVVVTTAGEACGGYDDGPFCSIADGLGCAYDLANEGFTTCEPLRQLDDDCLEVDQQAQTGVAYQCDPLAGLYCDMDFTTYTGVCVAKKAANAACEDDQECQSGWCNNGACADFSSGPCD